MRTPGILILAAGLGTRFHQAGGQGNKLLASYPDAQGNPQPLLKLTLDQALGTDLPVMVVTRPEQEAIHRLVTQSGAEILCVDSAGSGESIAAGVRATPLWQGWLIMPGDMAWVTTRDHQRVAETLQAGKPQVRLQWQQQPGHPVGFAAHYRERLSQLQGDNGARALIDPAAIVIIEAHRGVIQDADLPTITFRSSL